MKVTLKDVTNNFDGSWRTDKYSVPLRLAAWVGAIPAGIILVFVLCPIVILMAIKYFWRKIPEF